jgi:serine phosphatase RsbU (regulator of sigma subunit)
MATVRAALRSVAPNQRPAEALRSAARAIATDLDRTQSFVTLFHAELDPVAASLTWVDAGHGLAVILGSDGRMRTLDGTGLPVGVADDEAIADCSSVLERGETLIVCSDGLAESPADLAGIDALHAPDAWSTEAILAHVVMAARERGPATDDRTALAIRYTGEDA